MQRLLPYAMVLVLGLLSAATAEARTDRMLTYRQGQIWTGLVRFLRVDQGYRILERDREAGYLLFEYKDGGRDCSGSLEMVQVVESGRQYIRARLQIPSMPSYVEVVLFDKLERKLKNEYGDPPPAALVVLPGTGSDGSAAAVKPGESAKKKAPESEDDAEIDDDDLEDAVEEEDE
ncbi:MAG TPA: hypothetical protein VM285_07060 [Polyangia bacterium]|nr:hypothetical protein [Polyangia bacterium]